MKTPIILKHSHRFSWIFQKSVVFFAQDDGLSSSSKMLTTIQSSMVRGGVCSFNESIQQTSCMYMISSSNCSSCDIILSNSYFSCLWLQFVASSRDCEKDNCGITCKGTSLDGPLPVFLNCGFKRGC